MPHLFHDRSVGLTYCQLRFQRVPSGVTDNPALLTCVSCMKARDKAREKMGLAKLYHGKGYGQKG